MSVFHDFKYEPNQSIKGSAHDWLYDHVGVFAWTTEFWSPQRRAGIEDYHFIEWLRDHSPEDDLKLLKWADDEVGEGAYVDWYAFDHPQLGTVELGGWDVMPCWGNVPFKFLRGRDRAARRLGTLAPADLALALDAFARRRAAR